MTVLHSAHTYTICQNDLHWDCEELEWGDLSAVSHVAALCITMNGPWPPKISLREHGASRTARQGRAPVPQCVLRERCPVWVNKHAWGFKQQLAWPASEHWTHTQTHCMWFEGICKCLCNCKGYKRLMNQRQTQGKHCLCPVALVPAAVNVLTETITCKIHQHTLANAL